MKIAKIPVSVAATNKGCFRRRRVSPGVYEATCSQNTPRKKSRNESNISMKKYHHSPTLGVRSGSSSRTPYVASRKSHEPKSNAEPPNRAPQATRRPKVCRAVKAKGDGGCFDLSRRASYSKSRSGGNRRIGCMERYEAADRASTQVTLAPWQALAMAVRMHRLVKVEVERAMHETSAKGLNRKLRRVSQVEIGVRQVAYPAAMAALLHRKPWREEVKRRPAEARPVSAIWHNAWALSRSMAVKSRLVAQGCWSAPGRREKSGSSSGAWW